MKVMVKEAKNISTDVQYPELGNKDNGPSAQVVLPRELFTKYEGNSFFFHRANSSPVFHFSFISAYDVQNFHSAHKSVCRRAIEFFCRLGKVGYCVFYRYYVTLERNHDRDGSGIVKKDLISQFLGIFRNFLGIFRNF